VSNVQTMLHVARILQAAKTAAEAGAGYVRFDAPPEVAAHVGDLLQLSDTGGFWHGSFDARIDIGIAEVSDGVPEPVEVDPA